MTRSKDVAPRVEILLEASQEFRDSDKKIQLAIWEDDGLILTDRQKAIFMHVTPSESITRARRLLKVKYPASEDVDNARYENYLTEKMDHAGDTTKRHF